NLLGKKGPWETYPDRMLKLRARGFAARDGFADILRGVRSTEEALDMPVDDLPALPAAPVPQQPRRASEAKAGTPPQSISQPPAATPSTPPAPANDDQIDELLRGLKITNTSFVKPKGIEPYYEITAKASTGREFKFLTRDEAVYKEAASFEGTDHACVLAVRNEDGDPKSKTRVLVRLSIYEGNNDAAAGELFEQ